jgi:ppGpp synthetase/RelA/SpoT-type nucleotidyltranferase
MFADGGIVEGVSGYPLRLGGMQVNPMTTVGLVPIFENGGMVEGVSGYPLRLGGMQVNPLTTVGLVPIFEEGGYVSYKDKYNKKYNYKKGTAHSLEEISEDTGVSMKGLQQIYNKGIGAYKTNPASVRSTVKSKEQWAKARVYSAVMGGKAADVDAAELKMSKGGQVFNETVENTIYIPKILYHATYKPLLSKIKENGLDTSKSRKAWEDSVKGLVYLAKDIDVAVSYAESSELVPDSWIDNIIVLHIDTNKLDKSKFRIDQNVQDNEGDTLEYKGVIPFSAITEVTKYEQGGKVQKETYYIEFLNKKKGFQKDVIEFDSYDKAVKWAKDNFERFDYDMIRQRYDTGGTTQTHDSGLYKHWNKYPKTKHKKAYIISNNAAYDKDKYQAIFGDYDEDGIPNADDRQPLKPSQERVEGVSFVEQFDNLLEKRNISDEHLERFVDLIEETTPYDCTIYARTKTPYSIMKSLVDWKIVEDGNNYEAGIKDLLGTTVSFEKISDLEDYRNKVMSGDLGQVSDYRDYYENAKDGYRAYHFVVTFDGYPVEVQLKTNRMKELNEISHSLYKNKTLNKDFMLYLTTLANSADNGDKKSRAVYNKLLRNKEELTKKLSK